MKRDAVLAAFRHQKGPHLPYQVEMTREIKTRLCSRVGVAELDFGSWVGNYCEKVDIGETGVLNARGMYTDDFGVAWDRSGLDKDIGTIHNPILGEPVLGAYKFPVADTERARALLKAEANIPAGRAVFAKIGTTLFERAWSLTGFENFLMYLAVEQDFAREVLRNVCDHRLALVEAVLDLPFQGFYFGDDYGQQTGTLFSPETFRTVIKDELARLFAPVRAAGKLVVLHSCGNILTFLDDLVEIVLDGYQTVQPEEIGRRRVGKECRSRWSPYH